MDILTKEKVDSCIADILHYEQKWYCWYEQKKLTDYVYDGECKARIGLYYYKAIVIKVNAENNTAFIKFIDSTPVYKLYAKVYGVIIKNNNECYSFNINDLYRKDASIEEISETFNDVVNRTHFFPTLQRASINKKGYRYVYKCTIFGKHNPVKTDDFPSISVSYESLTGAEPNPYDARTINIKKFGKRSIFSEKEAYKLPTKDKHKKYIQSLRLEKEQSASFWDTLKKNYNIVKNNLEVKPMKRIINKKEIKRLELLSSLTNRSLNQTKELFELCDYKIHVLVELEQKIKTQSINSCPNNKQAIDTILKLKFTKPKIDQHIILKKYYAIYDQIEGKKIINIFKKKTKEPKEVLKNKTFQVYYALNGDFTSEGLPVTAVTVTIRGLSYKSTLRKYKIKLDSIIWSKEIINSLGVVADPKIISIQTRSQVRNKDTKLQRKRKKLSKLREKNKKVTNLPADNKKYRLVCIRSSKVVDSVKSTDVKRVIFNETIDGTYDMSKWHYCSKGVFKKYGGKYIIKEPKVVKINISSTVSKHRNNQDRVEFTYRKAGEIFTSHKYVVDERTKGLLDEVNSLKGSCIRLKPTKEQIKNKEKGTIVIKKPVNIIRLVQDTIPYSGEKEYIAPPLEKPEKQMEKGMRKAAKVAKASSRHGAKAYNRLHKRIYYKKDGKLYFEFIKYRKKSKKQQNKKLISKIDKRLNKTKSNEKQNPRQELG